MPKPTPKYDMFVKSVLAIMVLLIAIFGVTGYYQTKEEIAQNEKNCRIIGFYGNEFNIPIDAFNNSDYALNDGDYLEQWKVK